MFALLTTSCFLAPTQCRAPEASASARHCTALQIRWVAFPFGIDEDFSRLIRAANFETDSNTNRDINNLELKLIYHPSDHSIGGYLYYHNTIDIFERSSAELCGSHVQPLGPPSDVAVAAQTQVYGDISESIVTGIGSHRGQTPEKVDLVSTFAAFAGISTLFTIKTTFNVYAGYTNGFYSSGPSFSAPQVGAQLGYRYSPSVASRSNISSSTRTRSTRTITAITSSSSRLQQLVDPLVFMVQPELHFREYSGVDIVNGPATRDDVIFAVVAGAHYNFRNWLVATLNYRFSTVQTDYRYMPLGGPITDPSYVRHEVLLGIRVAM